MSQLDRLEELFQAASALSGARRVLFIDAACADDPELKSELEALLLADADASREAFLDEPFVHLPALESAEGDRSPQGSVQEGSEIGPYTVIRRIGRGGMGDVYLARRDRPFKRYVAIKIIRRGMDTSDVLQRFQMERQILAALDHPSIARLLDGGVTEDGLPYFAMDYVDGTPLTGYCESRRLGIEQRLKLFRVACEAVHYAHQNLVLHRDLKPSNILVTEDGQVKLLDFGIAKLLNPHLSPVTMPVTRTELRLMTPEYASPEQIRGDTLTTSSDVYSLGVILYELLTGLKPYSITGRSPQEIARAVCDEEPIRPSLRVARTAPNVERSESDHELDPLTAGALRTSSAERVVRRLRGDLDNIVLTALRKEPARRYASAEQLGKDVLNHLEGRPVWARPSTVAYRVSKFVHRNRAATVGGIAVLVALAGGMAASLWQASMARDERNRAEAARVEAERALSESEAVTDYVTELFGAIDPYESPGEELTARELLEHGVQQVSLLDDQPLIQARMLDMFAHVYRAMGRYDLAEELLDRGLAIRRDATAPPGDVAATIYTLADVLRRNGKYSDAEKLYQEALALYREVHGELHPTIGYALNGLAMLMMNTGRYEESEPLFRQALDLRRALYGDEHNEVAFSMSSLGMLLRRLEAYDEAEALFRRSLEIYRRLYGDGHPYVYGNLNSLGLILRDRGDFAGAESVFREAVEGITRVHGEEHPHTAVYVHNLADALRRAGRHDEAQRLFLNSLEVKRRLLHATHPDIGLTLTYLAASHGATDDFERSETLYEEALALYHQNFDDSHPQVQEVYSGLVELYEAWQKPEPARRYRRKIIPSRTAEF